MEYFCGVQSLESKMPVLKGYGSLKQISEERVTR